MRAVLLLAVVLLLPTAVAEWGAYGPDGWPVNAMGESTAPPAVTDAGPLNVAAGATFYPYWPILTVEVERLAEEHPDRVRLHSAGKSTLGLDLWMLEIADFARIEAGDGIPLEAREVVWVDGGTHSNEYSGVYFTAHLASFLADEYETNETAAWIVQNRHTWIMPMVNPDGSNAFGRLNAHGVNINRNYPVVWDGEGHDPLMNNRGEHPASEVETQINIEWFNRTQPDLYVSVHCCGNLWLYPYGEEGVDPVDDAVLARVCEEAFPTVRADCGPIWSTIYPASGSSVDTAYEYTGAIAFGYEMSGRGAVSFWGQPFTHVAVREQEVESWEGLMHGFLNVHRYGAHPVVTDVRVDGPGALAVTVLNDGYGDLAQGLIAFQGVQVPLPPLASGEQATVRVETPLSEGILPLRIEHVKRLQAAPTGATDVDLELRDAPGGLRVAGFGETIVPLGEAHETPGFMALAVLVSALAGAFLGRVRRGRRDA